MYSVFFVEFYSHERSYITPIGDYAKKQVKNYEDNLTLTDFERTPMKELDVLQKLWIIVKKMFWPLVSIIVLVLFAGIYSLIIYYVIPQNAIAEYIIRPSLIVVAILYTVILIRINSILPKIKDEDSIPIEINEVVTEQ